MIRFAACIFLSAFLLFQVQPFICKVILPWFGGTSSVWATCVAFFQTVLFGGYLYAHLSATYLTRRQQGFVHTALLLGALAFLPVLPGDPWKPESGQSPLLQIAVLLAANVGLPFFVLASNGPLVQSWFAREFPGRSPCRLYALSNIGSLLALATYPFAVEPLFKLREQSWIWSGLFGAFVLLCASCALLFRSNESPAPAAPPEDPAEPAAPAPRLHLTGSDRLLWILLPACASLMLVATTNLLSQDVAVVPFLWILPLAIYLLSFIFTFESDRWYFRPAWGAALVCALVGAYEALNKGVDMQLIPQILIHSGTLLTICMICHGELARLKPHPRFLTSFYLLLSLGGALGGIAATLGAPLVFNDIWEYPIGLMACAALLLAMLARDRTSLLYRGAVPAAWLVLLVLFGGFGFSFFNKMNELGKYATARARNFYGVLKINDYPDNSPPSRTLMHGRINHGSQYFSDEVRRTPVTYYGEESGVGVSIRTLRQLQPDTPLRIGMVGLGTGTIAAWGAGGDTVRFYEINPQVVEFSKTHFTYTSESPAKIEIALGDARLVIDREVALPEDKRLPRLDLLALDAFSSDAIPLHLLTREAFESYWKRVRDDGIVAVHISNRFLSLYPLVAGLAEATHRKTVYIDADGDSYNEDSTWVVVTNNPAILTHPLMVERGTEPSTDAPPLVFTDDYSNLYKILKR